MSGQKKNEDSHRLKGKDDLSRKEESSSGHEETICVVCGDKATKYRYSHYGKTSCFSCRAFFRRTVVKENHDLFYCSEGNCEITVQTRKKCQFCRFQKCRTVGMKYKDMNMKTNNANDRKKKCSLLENISSNGRLSCIVRNPQTSVIRPTGNILPLSKPGHARVARADSTVSHTLQGVPQSLYAPSPISRTFQPSSFTTCTPLRSSTCSTNPMVGDWKRDRDGTPQQQTEEMALCPIEHLKKVVNSKQPSSRMEGIEDGGVNSSLSTRNSNVCSPLPSGSTNICSPPATCNNDVYSPSPSRDSKVCSPLASRVTDMRSLLPTRDICGPQATSPTEAGVSNQRIKAMSSLGLDLASLDQAGRSFSENLPTIKEIVSTFSAFDPYTGVRDTASLSPSNLWGSSSQLNTRLDVFTSNESLPNTSLSEEDEERIEKLVEMDTSILIDWEDIPRDITERVVSEMYNKSINKNSLDYSCIFWGYTFAIKKITWFAQTIPEFRLCSFEDEKELLLQNLDPMFNIKAAMFFCNDSLSLLEQMKKFCVFDTKNLCNEYSINIPAVKWNQFFCTPWATNLEHERKYENLLEEARNLKLDEQSACLMQVVALFSTDSATLQNMEQVQQIQDKYLDLLYRYLAKRDGETIVKEVHQRYVSMLSCLREMADIMRNQTLKL